MPSYVITGVSRGIGFEFLQNISSNPSNTVIGLARNVSETETKIASWGRSNIHILEGDLSNYDTLKRAAAATSEITSGSLDYLIANAGHVSRWSAFDPMSALGSDPNHLTKDLNEAFDTNVVGNIHLFNLFLPLILKGEVKKVIAISSGMADAEPVTQYAMDQGGPYSISKAALNMAVAKFHAEYEKHGVLFMAICPGLVDTGHNNSLTEEQTAKLMVQIAKFKAYAPHFTGPATAEESVKDVLKVIEQSSLKNGNGGAYVSHTGTKQWI